jgi:hypothetical protein
VKVSVYISGIYSGRQSDQYANLNLSVTLIADRFSFSKSYIFRVFKKGENCGINEVTAKIGYTKGITPTEYRYSRRKAASRLSPLPNLS